MERATFSYFKPVAFWNDKIVQAIPRRATNKVLKLTVGILQTYYGQEMDPNQVRIEVPHRKLTSPYSRKPRLTKPWRREASPTKKTDSLPMSAKS